MLSPRIRLAGLVALLLAPVLAIAATLARPTLSDDAANQVAALTNHRGAMIAGLALSTIAVVLLTAGIVWLALMLAQRSPGLVIPGAVLGVFGSLAVAFLNGVGAAAPTIVHELDPARATATLHHIQSSAAVSGLEPLQLLGDIGVALLGIAAVKAGTARWAAAAIAIGALGEGAGFGAQTRTVVIVAFAILFVGLVQTARTLARAPRGRLAANAVAAP